MSSSSRTKRHHPNRSTHTEFAKRNTKETKRKERKRTNRSQFFCSPVGANDRRPGGKRTVAVGQIFVHIRQPSDDATVESATIHFHRRYRRPNVGARIVRFAIGNRRSAIESASDNDLNKKRKKNFFLGKLEIILKKLAHLPVHAFDSEVAATRRHVREFFPTSGARVVPEISKSSEKSFGKR